tara:strand:- start:2228 stop:2461 length:234 start_codon:yes stop_codon:yes gene_type:complete
MNKYQVVIQATVTKAMEIHAKDEESAIEQAHTDFSLISRASKYEQDDISCELIVDRNDRHLTQGESGWDHPDKEENL